MLLKREAKTFGPVLYSVLNNPNNHQKNVLISHLDDDSFDYFCNCVNSVIYKPDKLNLDESDLENLRSVLSSEKDLWRFVANPKVSRKRKRKRISVQKGSGIFTLLATVVSIIATLAIDASRKK